MKNSTRRRSTFQSGLPLNFNQDLIQLESSYEKGNKNIEDIKQLLNLYSMAIEYFDSIKDVELYQLYLLKNNQILVDPEIRYIIEDSSLGLNSKLSVIKTDSSGPVKCSVVSDLKEHVNLD